MKPPRLLRPRIGLRSTLCGCLILLIEAAVAAASSAMPPMQHMSMDQAAPTTLHSKPVVAVDLLISAVWARSTVAGVPVGAVYFTIQNRGKQADTLLGASSAIAASAMLHQTTQHNGIAHMAPAGAIDIAPGATLKVEPGGLHLMLNGLKKPLVAGSYVPVTLRFRHAGTVSVQVEIVPLAATGP